jgi:hypothetical protein
MCIYAMSGHKLSRECINRMSRLRHFGYKPVCADSRRTRYQAGQSADGVRRSGANARWAPSLKGSLNGNDNRRDDEGCSVDKGNGPG